MEKNETMCWWKQPQSGVIRDMWYLDGGKAGYRLPNSSLLDSAPRSSLWYIDFSGEFNTSQKPSDIIHAIPKPNVNAATNYYDGAMFANDDELYLYGGLLRNTDSQTPPGANEILRYERYQHGSYRSSWAPGWSPENLPSGLTRYIYGGASVNVPSENLGFYYSGLRGVNWGDIRDGGNNYKGNVSANTLISVDMSATSSGNWRNATLPSNIAGRAGAELAWIPVSTQGVLLVIGGVINPEYGNFLTGTQRLESQKISPVFMREIPVYDIAGQKWYTQNTTGEAPGPLTQFCSVVASAKDKSSHSVYIYGGYSGIDITEKYVDDVYILSVPSFVWTKVYTGTAQHGRIRHKCSKPYPDQMFVVGGEKSADPIDCVEGGIVQIFNLNDLRWQNNYNPHVWSEYKVPPAVLTNIGGSADGDARKRSPDTWGDRDLSTLFHTKYSKPIQTYYPYTKTVASGSGHHGVSTLVPAVLGTVFTVTTLVLCWFLYRQWSSRSRALGEIYELDTNIVAATELPAFTSTECEPTLLRPESPTSGSTSHYASQCTKGAIDFE